MDRNRENEDNPNTPVIGRAAVGPTDEPKPSREDVDVRQFGSSRSRDPSFERLPVNKRHQATPTVGSDGRRPRGGRGGVSDTVPSFGQWEDDVSGKWEDYISDLELTCRFEIAGSAAKVTYILKRVEVKKLPEKVKYYRVQEKEYNKVGHASTTTRELDEKAKKCCCFPWW